MYLAIDLGASGGRLITGKMKSGKLQIEEVHRFDNGAVSCDGDVVWDADSLFAEIITGMKKLTEVPTALGIDSWAVDYCLDYGGEFSKVMCYRSARTARAVEAVHKIIPPEQLYSITGIQFQPFNTVYQLYADKLAGRLDGAKRLMMMPEYLSYRLCGEAAREYTNATSTGLINARTRGWSFEIIDALGLPRELFGSVEMPPIKLGKLLPEIAAEVGFSCDVYLPATHDTASAVMCAGGGDAYLSSGTWSLMGAENSQPILTPEARAANFTNEGGFEGKFRFLKNISGMYPIQKLRDEGGRVHTFATLARLAEESGFSGAIDVNDPRFSSPKSMTQEVENYFRERGSKVPQTAGELANAVYNGLACAYKACFDELEQLTDKKYAALTVVGGGSNNDYLNRLTAETTGKKVRAGVSEASAVGNIISLMIGAGELPSLAAGRELVHASFGFREYGGKAQ